MRPLIFAEPDEQVTIQKVTGKDAVRSHLSHLGLTENETVSIKQSINGNLIVEVKGVRIALDSSLARRIMI